MTPWRACLNNGMYRSLSRVGPATQPVPAPAAGTQAQSTGPGHGGLLGHGTVNLWSPPFPTSHLKRQLPPKPMARTEPELPADGRSRGLLWLARTKQPPAAAASGSTSTRQTHPDDRHPGGQPQGVTPASGLPAPASPGEGRGQGLNQKLVSTAPWAASRVG